VTEFGELSRDVDVEEAEWVRRSCSGDARAFGRLVERYQGRLLNAVTRTVGRQADAEDIVQEAFMRAFEAIDRFRQRSTFYTWLYRIAFNLVASVHRQRRRFSNPGEAAPVEELEADNTANPGAHAEANEQRHRVQQAINELSETFRVPLVLREIEGMNYGEIGEVLRIPVGTVKSRIYRARLDLRDKLRDLL
jgi:RNA polymerase sigma-70 factor (ECF subfamily)